MSIQIRDSEIRDQIANFKLQISDSEFRFRFRIQIQNSDSEFRFRIQIQNSDSDSKFKIQIRNLRLKIQQIADSEYSLQTRTANSDCKFRFQIQLQIRIANSDYRFRFKIQIFIPSLLSRYVLLIIADSLGVLDLSGTLSSSTIAHPWNLTFSRAAKTPGRSTRPRPSSTNR